MGVGSSGPDNSEPKLLIHGKNSEEEIKELIKRYEPKLKLKLEAERKKREEDE